MGGYAVNREAIEAKAVALVPLVEHIRGPAGEPTYRFLVPSSSSGGYYEVDARGVPRPRLDNLLSRALCNCQAAEFGVRGCSHVTAVWLRWVAEIDEQAQQPALEDLAAVPGPKRSLAAIAQQLRTSQDLGGQEQVALLIDYGRRVRALQELPTSEIEQRLRRYQTLPPGEREILETEYRKRNAIEGERFRVWSGQQSQQKGNRTAWQEEI